MPRPYHVSAAGTDAFTGHGIKPHRPPYPESSPDFEKRSSEERGGGGRNWEIGIDIYTLQILYIKQITHETLLYNPGNSTQCSVVT